MKKFTFAFLTAAVLAAMTLTACFGGGTSEPTRYYTLAVENIDMPSAGNASGRLQVRKFTIDQAYQRSTANPHTTSCSTTWTCGQAAPSRW